MTEKVKQRKYSFKQIVDKLDPSRYDKELQYEFADGRKFFKPYRRPNS